MCIRDRRRVHGLLDFYKQYYSANIMRLVLYGQESLDELEKMAHEKFSDVKNYDIPLPKIIEKPFDSENLQRLLKVHPVKDWESIEIAWFMDNMNPHYKSNPHKYCLLYTSPSPRDS
eukprot:TRINITY_DN4163_c0_g1_i3.p1 TRINITY_DN4163_c0_g1~~TRINITY_DN4163_c0_g1_i3.p1  ORF type:complete len:117 (+),score=34.09 TRINITY_DN4163_c0_g1_i3:64-414(+)